MQNFKNVMIRYPDGVGYNEEAKEMFGKHAKAYLKKLAKELGISGPVSWNKGGIAGSGDISLKGMFNSGNGVYVLISYPNWHGIMFRSIKDANDSTGGPNQWFNPEHFEEYGDLARYIKRRLGEDTTQEH